jgi:ABC-2 type transport system permease protein
MTSDKSVSRGRSRRGPFSELLRVEGKLALRAPYGLGLGIIFPTVLLVVFGLIGSAVPGTVANTGFTILELYIPIIIVIEFFGVAITALPIPLVRDRESGWLRRVSTTPVGPSRVLAAQLVLNLAFALVGIVIVLLGSVVVFGASLSVGIYFVFSTILVLAEIFSLGLVIAAIAPSQSAQNAISGALFFAMLFLSGLWYPAAEASGPLQTIMYYSPGGAAVNAMLGSVFGTAPPLTAVVTMVVYAVIFVAVAIRYFRWE